MKTKFTFCYGIITYFIFCYASWGQSGASIVVGDIVKFDIDVPVLTQPSLFIEKTTSDDYANYLPKGDLFKILQFRGDEVDVIALPYDPYYSEVEKANAKKAGETLSDKSDAYNNKVYTISKIYFDAAARKVEPVDRVSVGLLTLPFKMRPQNDVSFDTEFNLNTTLNFYLKPLFKNSTSLNLQVGGGLGTVSLTPQNSTIDGDKTQDVTTLTFLSGLMLQYKRVQFGVYTGVDWINNQSTYNWESNGNIWFGFGVGYNVFNISVSSEKSQPKN